jgi:hypothetical protein
VNEVNLDGNVLRLTSLDLPTPSTTTESKSSEDVKKEDNKLSDTEAGCKELESFMDEENTAKLRALVENENDVETIIQCKVYSQYFFASYKGKLLTHNFF